MSTGIEWTDETWNPVVGCEAVSPGCDHCYAATVASRGLTEAHRGLTIGRQWNGTVRLLPERLGDPLRWRKPRRLFVGSMTDLFHRDVPPSYIAAIWDVMARCPQHTFQVLTKRPQRMAELASRSLNGGHGEYPLQNVWLGTSIESDRYTWRADHLRATPAAVRFLSLEPLLGPLPSLDLTGIDWVIVGGESGAGARPMHSDWVRDIRDRCVDAGVAFFFKQRGAWAPINDEQPTDGWVTTDGLIESAQWSPLDERMARVGKKAAGRKLDGRTWDEFPGVEK